MAKKSDLETKGDDPNELIDKNINFEQRDMHKTWPLVKGCLMFIAVAAAFIFISTYVFNNWSSWF